MPRIIAYLALAALIVGAALHVFANQAHACSCPRSTIEEALERSDAAFVGEVVSIDTHKVKMFSNKREDIIQFETSEVWKGQPHRTIYVKRVWKRHRDSVLFIFRTTLPCPTSFSFLKGERYLVFVYVGREDFVCSPSRQLEYAQDSLRALGPGKVPVSGSTGPVPSRTQAIPVELQELGLFGILALLVAPFVWLKTRNRIPR